MIKFERTKIQDQNVKKQRQYTKSFRVQVLMDILKRWGKLDKQQICEHVGQILQEDFATEAFQRAILRDLEDQVQSHRISVDYLTRDGVKIEDYNPDINKNVKCVWYIQSAEGQIPGSGVLETLGSQIYVPKILKNDVTILQGKSQADPRNIHFYFILSGTFICLKISCDGFPLNIVVSRTHGEITDTEISNVVKKLGMRTILLKIPSSRISSYKDEKILGHFIVKINNKDDLHITDLKSSNGTKIYKLKQIEADKIREIGARTEDMTLNETWKNIDPTLVKPITIDETLSFPTPFLLEASESFRILAI